jgi:hypothetical protein
MLSCIIELICDRKINIGYALRRHSEPAANTEVHAWVCEWVTSSTKNHDVSIGATISKQVSILLLFYVLWHLLSSHGPSTSGLSHEAFKIEGKIVLAFRKYV